MTYLLDTNVVSELRRSRPNPVVMTWFQTVPEQALFVSVLTVGEIVKGAALRRRRDPATARVLDSWAETVRTRFAGRVVAVDLSVAEEWGRLGAVRPLPAVDGLLAATARVHGLTLVTRNVRDVADLEVAVLDPWQARPPG